MAQQRLSVRLPESIRFPEGVSGEELVQHLMAWYFYSCGNNESAIELTGESPVELEKKLLEFGFARQWITRMSSEKTQKKAQALELIKEADALTRQRESEGWSGEDFKKDFLRVQKEIAGMLKKREDEARV